MGWKENLNWKYKLVIIKEICFCSEHCLVGRHCHVLGKADRSFETEFVFIENCFQFFVYLAFVLF